MRELIQLLFNGLVTGGVICTAAAGLALTMAILDIGTFAYGDYLTFGAYVAFGVSVAWGQSLIVGLIGAVVATAALGLTLDFVVMRHFRSRSDGGSLFIVTLGLALILRYSIFIVTGPAPRQYPIDPYQVYNLAGIVLVTPAQIIVIIVAIAALGALSVMLARTMVGKSMRALATNRDLAAIAGVQTPRMRFYVWAIAAGLAGLGGVLQALVQTTFVPTMGWDVLFLFFTAVILGGIGSAFGALVGGLVIGLAMELSTWSALGGGLPTAYKPVVAYVVLLAILFMRPQGLFGRAR